MHDSTLFQRATALTTSVTTHIRTTDWVRVSGEAALVSLAVWLGTIINIYLSVDAAAQLDWTLANVGFIETTGPQAVVLGILAAAVVGPLVYGVLVATERIRRLDSPVRRWLTLVVGSQLLVIVIYTVILIVLIALEPAEAADELAGLGPLEILEELYAALVDASWEPHRLVAVFAIPAALVVAVHTGLRRGVSIRGRRTQAVTIGLVLLVVVPTAAAAVMAPAPPTGEETDDTGGWVETESLEYKPADQSALACDNSEPTADPPDDVGFFGEDGYQPAATTTGTDHVRVSQIRVHPADAERESHISETEYRLQLQAPDGEPVNDAQVVRVTAYGTTLSVDRDHTHNEIYSLNGTVSIDSEATKVHVLADIATENGSVHRYVFPLCPPTEGGE